MGIFRDLSGQRFGRLTVARRGPNQRKLTRWFCRCDCGNESLVIATMLNNGKTRSCGCLRRENSTKLKLSHGKTYTPEYHAWCGAKRRCYGKSDPAYKNYGGRGIKVCPQWLNSFETFLADVGLRPSPKHSLDRIDNNGDYEPGNCRWATDHQQARNKRNNRWVMVRGERLSIADCAKLTGLFDMTVRDLLRNGWTMEELLDHKSK